MLGRAVFALCLLSASAGAAELSCNGDGYVACRDGACGEKQTLYSSMFVDFRTSRLQYCIGSGCFSAVIRIVKADQEELFAFNALREAGGGGQTSGLVTIHAGRRTATVGQFQADGTVTVSPMTCQGPN